MKAWFNEKGNWCFEFESKQEKETERFIVLVAQALRFWRRRRRKYREAFISAALFNACIGEIFIGQNYTQSHPTIDKPLVCTSEEMAKCAIKTAEEAHEIAGFRTEPGWNAEGFNKRELALIKQKLNEKKLHELL